jgi:hypothetical protein
MALVFVFDIEIKSFPNKSESLADSTIWSPTVGDVVIVFIVPQVYDLVVHLVLKSVVFLDVLAMTFDYFFTEILIHFAKL